ncbi:MAG: lipid-A-disaccharide synthase, partial [Dokdonella sp.]
RGPRFVLVAGEASGDLLGASLIDALRQRHPDAEFAGIGGPRMIAVGLDAWHAAESLAVMGLVEVVRHLPRLLAIRRDTRRRCQAWSTDVFIGIDAPDFNLPLERMLKQRGLRTVHYVSPSVWAWREQRARKIGRSADRVLCLFPMEPPIYAQHGVDARFVGHPLADSFAMQPDQPSARASLQLDGDRPVLAVLPGSRLGEIRRLGADFIDAAALLQQDLPGLQVIAPMANPACREVFESVLAERSQQRTDGRVIDIRVLDGNPHAAMIAADAVLLASGTAALEAMLAKRPMVVAYRLAPLTYRIVRTLGLLKVARYSLPNVLAGRELVTELMQEHCTPPALRKALLPLLGRTQADTDLQQEYARLHRSLQGDASRNAAAAISELLPP